MPRRPVHGFVNICSQQIMKGAGFVPWTGSRGLAVLSHLARVAPGCQGEEGFGAKFKNLCLFDVQQILAALACCRNKAELLHV